MLLVDRVLFSSKSMEWETPQQLFELLDEEFAFTLDVCATKENSKCKKYFDINIDGLKQDWSKDICWMNPPYGREIANWIRKAFEEHLNGAIVVCLLPVRTDTKWFHDYIYGIAEIRFLKGRLRFSNSKNSAPFPSMVVIFDNDGHFLD